MNTNLQPESIIEVWLSWGKRVFSHVYLLTWLRGYNLIHERKGSTQSLWKEKTIVDGPLNPSALKQIPEPCRKAAVERPTQWLGYTQWSIGVQMETYYCLIDLWKRPLSFHTVIAILQAEPIPNYSSKLRTWRLRPSITSYPRKIGKSCLQTLVG